jgi:hypothetical protein
MSANNNEEVMVFPIAPTDTNLTIPQNNEEFQTINAGTLNLIGDIGLKTVSIDSIFPTHEYSWLKIGSSSDGWEYVEFLNTWRAAKVPLRIVMTLNDNSEWLNMACLIENFTYGLMRNEDIRYNLTLKEYRFIEVA